MGGGILSRYIEKQNKNGELDFMDCSPCLNSQDKNPTGRENECGPKHKET